jgi:acetyl esterase/lipase
MSEWKGWQVLRDLGDEFSPRAIETTRQLYLADALRPDPATVTRDLSYGADARHRLDVFTAGGKSPRPVVVFVHGGGFAAGDKGGADAPFYNNIGAWAVRSGFVGVNLTYRLTPAHPWPAGAQDVALGLQWIARNIDAHGGDPRRIVLIGQSAGAAHVSAFLAGQGRDAAADTPLAGAVLLSGIYEPDPFRVDPMQDAYYGTDRALQSRQSAVVALATTATPCLYTISEFDPSIFHRQLAAVVEARAAATGRCPETLWLTGHNHFSSSLQIGGPIDTLGEPLAAFVRRVCG